MNKQFLSGTVRANDALDKRNIFSEFVTNNFQAKKGGTHRKKNRLKVGEGTRLTLVLWKGRSCEFTHVVVLGHKIQIYL